MKTVTLSSEEPVLPRSLTTMYLLSANHMWVVKHCNDSCQWLNTLILSSVWDEGCSGLGMREQVISGQMHTLLLGRSIGFKKYGAILRGLSHKKWSCLDVLYIFNPPQPEQHYDICLFSLKKSCAGKETEENQICFSFCRLGSLKSGKHKENAI